MMKLNGCRGRRAVCLLAPMWGEESDGEHLERLSPGLLLLARTRQNCPRPRFARIREDLHPTRGLDHDMTLSLRVLNGYLSASDSTRRKHVPL
jgi:hypothetical protein